MSQQVGRVRLARTSHAVAASVVAALALAGCSSDSGSGSEEPAPFAEGVATVGEAAGTVDSVSWGLPYGEPDTIDPANTGYYSSALVATQMCEPLLRLEDDYSISPGLATLTQPDDLSLVLTLRQGVTFWDGSPMTTDDVVWSLEHSRAPENLVSFLFGKVASITATGTDEVTITLATPDSLLPQELATFAGSVQEAAFSEAAGDQLGTASTGVMCTGPMQFDSWQPGTGITLTRNANYWDPEHAANSDQIDFTFSADSSGLAQALTSGEIDGAYEVPPAVIPSLQDSSNGQVYFGSPSTQYLSLLALQPDGALASPDVREALFSTIDRSAIASGIYNGAASPNYTYTARGVWDNAAWSDEAKQIFEQSYDQIQSDQADWGSAEAISSARSAAEDAGYTGEPIVLAVPAGDATLGQVAQLIQAQAKAAGFDLQIQQLQPIDYSNALVDPSARSGLDLALSSSFSTAPNPVETLQFTFAPGAPYNYTNYDNSEVTDLVNQAWETTDQVAQAQALTQAEGIYEQNYASMTIVQLNEVVFLNDRLSGATASFAYLNNASVARIGASS